MKYHTISSTIAKLIEEHYGSDMTTALVELRERINEFSKKFDEL